MAKDLRSAGGPWRLPVWPTFRRVRSALSIKFAEWSDWVRLPPRVRNACGSTIWRAMSRFQLPRPPSAWEAVEFGLRSSKNLHGVVVDDDKTPGKAWTIPAIQLKCLMLAQLLADSSWVLQHAMSPRLVLDWMFARARLGLPSFLLKWPQTPRRQATAPRLFGFIKV